VSPPVPRLLVMVLVLAAGAAVAQETEPTTFYRVYGYETPLAGWLEPALWTTYVASSDNAYDHFGRDGERQGLWAHALEAELGVTDHLSLAGYLDFADPSGAAPDFTEGRIEARYRLAQRYAYPLNVALYAEYVLPRKSYSNSQELETRLILDRDFEDVRMVLNPILPGHHRRRRRPRTDARLCRRALLSPLLHRAAGARMVRHLR
jgi:hypothetical protein